MTRKYTKRPRNILKSLCVKPKHLPSLIHAVILLPACRVSGAWHRLCPLVQEDTRTTRPLRRDSPSACATRFPPRLSHRETRRIPIRFPVHCRTETARRDTRAPCSLAVTLLYTLRSPRSGDRRVGAFLDTI